jgi:hypothetical protein
MVAMGVEWADRPEPADAAPSHGHDARRNAGRDAGQAADRDGPDAGQAADRPRLVMLTDPERRAAEHARYRAVAEQPSGAARAWSAAVPEFRAAWEKIKVKYGHTERRGPVAQPADGSWRGAGSRRLDHAQNAEIDRACARIREVGERAIIPGVRAVEAEDPARALAGFERRFKGLDRLKEKVADQNRSTPGITTAQALSTVPDAVRFTYKYDEAVYTAGVRKDIERLEACGFVQVERRNTWTSDQYKGINTRWQEPESRLTFEVQFHTSASLEAKELTHKAYERIRSITEQTPETDRETSELKEFQREVNAKVPIPPGVMEYEDYRPERRNGRRD